VNHRFSSRLSEHCLRYGVGNPPLIGKPGGEFSDGGRGQIEQQLCEVELRIHVTTAVGTHLGRLSFGRIQPNNFSN